MNTIMGMADLMPTTNLNSIQLEYLAGIKKTSHALLQIINDILDFSKIEAGKVELVPVHFNIAELFSNIVSMFEFAAEQKQLDFVYSCAADVPSVVYGDEVRIRQIITNLTNNAIKYTRAGTVKLKLEYEMKDGRNCHVLTVSDTGVGIKADDMPRLFNNFQQFDTRANRNILGTGLGLAITQRFVQLMDGEISVHSEYGKGTEFRVCLPLPPGEKSKIEREDAITEKMAVGKENARVLVVDDAHMNLIVAKGFLTRHHIAVETAESGAKAIETLKKNDFDLVFMDHMMPGLDGIETTRLIRGMGGKCGVVPIVALTANAISGIRQLFLDAGMNDCITKPIDAKQLNNVLMEWMPSDKIEIVENGNFAGSVSVDDSDLPFQALLISGAFNVGQALKRLGGDRKAYGEMLTLFHKDGGNMAQALKELAARKNWKDFSIKAHALKGICASIGAEALSTKLSRLENESAVAAEENRDCVAASGEMETLCVELEYLVRLVDTAHIIKPEAEKTAVDKADFAKRVGALQTACKDAMHGEIDAGDALEALVKEIQRITYTPEYDVQLEAACTLIEDLEYDKAFGYLERILLDMERIVD